MKGKMNFNLDMLNLSPFVIIIFLAVIMVRRPKEDFMYRHWIFSSAQKEDGSTDWDSELNTDMKPVSNMAVRWKKVPEKFRISRQTFSRRNILGALKRRQNSLKKYKW